MKNRAPNPELADVSDQELAADLRMVATEEYRLERELTARGYEVGCTLRYESGAVSIEINRVEKQAL